MQENRESLLLEAEIGEVPTLDLHGFDTHQAIKELQDFLSRNVFQKHYAVKVICGHGTQKLHRAILTYLRSKPPHVIDWRNASLHTHQSGAVIVIALH